MGQMARGTREYFLGVQYFAREQKANPVLVSLLNTMKQTCA
jgi:hypothetical protein